MLRESLKAIAAAGHCGIIYSHPIGNHGHAVAQRKAKSKDDCAITELPDLPESTLDLSTAEFRRRE